jgi:translation initiation factor 2B subunit (eIF-2B alpha/beta/delta family)
MWPAARIEALAADRGHGASYLAREAVEILVESAAEGEDALRVARALAAARPAMGAIAAAVGRVVAAAGIAEQVVLEGRALLDGYERAGRSIAVLAAPLVLGRVCTHSTSATVAEVLAYSQAKATERIENADLFLIGADTVFRDGSIVNAAGTRAVAEKAAASRLPVVVAAETLKLVPTARAAPAEELFDLTPAELVDWIVTEEGVFPPAEIAALVDRTPFLRAGYELVAHTPVP